MQPNHSDPVIDEIRAIRHKISAQFDHDISRLVAYYIEMQKKYQDRLIDTSKDRERKDPSPLDPCSADPPKLPQGGR